MVQQRMLLQLTLVGVVIAAMAVQGSARAKQGCQDRCGNVSIPYPFGMTKGCYYNDDFLITCSKNFSTPKPFLWRSNYNIINISIFDGEVNILQQIAHDCYDQLGTRIEYNEATVNLSTMRLSSTKNKFTVIGCDTFAYMEGYQGDKPYLSGCISLCDRMDYVSNGSCSGIGCCQTAIPEGVSFYQVELTSNTNYTSVWKFSPCGYAFVVEEDKFNFSLAILTGLRSETYIPAVLDWVISNETCEVAKKNSTGSYACVDNNSVCYDTTNNAGYRCRCLEGYQGNPYLAGGCQDVDECEDAGLNQCEGVCTNIPGNYTCSCPKGHRGDGRKDGKGCSRHEKLLIYKIGIGIAIGVVVLIMAFSWLYLVHKRRKLFKLKEKFFRQNGGLLLKQKLSQQEGSTETTKIFTAEELEKATDNYADSKIIGKGGFGTVYKGVLKDNIMAVAIKKSKVVDQSQIDQFINEMIVLSQINHRNVVKLLGCCLEESVPLLVYEFIPNGTLHDHIHNERKASLVSWEIRLRIAAETAGVLSYLHSAAVIPIIHRDIKSTNILLDDNYTAKVCDFGVSRLVPLDEMQLSTIVQGTFGYLDPEYMHTSQLTEKSDVYSFGVVLVELLTGKKVVSFNRPEDERCLAMHFLISLKDDRLFEILDDCVVQEGNTEQLKEVAKIARSCLRVKGEERPTMKQVAVELESLRMVGKHPWINEDSEETELLGVASDASGFEGSRNTTTSYDNIKEHIVLPLRSGR